MSGERSTMSEHVEVDRQHIEQVWRQGVVPVVHRPPHGQPIMVRLPYRQGNRAWLAGGRRLKLEWHPDGRYWSLPCASFSQLVERLVREFGSAYVIQPYRVQEKCAPACWKAKHVDCMCSCMGAHHGMMVPGGRWYVISETCAVRWTDTEDLRCSLLTLKTEGEK